MGLAAIMDDESMAGINDQSFFEIEKWKRRSYQHFRISTRSQRLPYPYSIPMFQPGCRINDKK